MLSEKADSKMSKYRDTKMTPSQQAKSVGLKNLTQVSKMTGQSLNTLINWHRNKPELFEIVLEGCLSRVFKEIEDE